ncbi:MAG: thermonuclease family protein [Candidatus Delongbacteria bacterium]|nr:thermonuclease family protein [Candidatus Delongbacteria bacterium]
MKTWGLIVLSLIVLALIVAYLIMSRHALHIVEVVDGDTIRLSNGETIRLLGIDTPEIHDERTSVQFYGHKASEFLHHLALNQEVLLQFESIRRDKYNRVLAYVTLRQSGLCLNEEMIRQGYAFVYTRFPFQRFEQFRKLQIEAIHSGRGLWAESWRDSLPTIERKQDLIRNAFKDARLPYPPDKPVSSVLSINKKSSGSSLVPVVSDSDSRRNPQPAIADSKEGLPPPPDGFHYIGNKNSKVLHRWNCSSVKKMKSQNKVLFKTPDQAWKDGYKPCPRCMKTVSR